MNLCEELLIIENELDVRGAIMINTLDSLYHFLIDRGYFERPFVMAEWKNNYSKWSAKIGLDMSFTAAALTLSRIMTNAARDKQTLIYETSHWTSTCANTKKKGGKC